MINKSKSFNNKKQSNLYLYLIVLLLIIITVITLAFFADSDFATSFLGTSGRVKIEAVGRGGGIYRGY